MKQKMLSFMLALCMILSLIPMNAFASTAVEFEFPTATVTKIANKDLTFALNFKANEVTDEQLAYYKDWYADFVLTVNKDVTFNANGEADGYLSGQYDEWSENWVSVPFEDVTLNAGESLKIMETAAEMLGQKGLKLTYNDVYSFVKDFDCGVFFEEAFLNANPDLEVTLELRMYNPENEAESYTIGETYVYTLDDVKAELPTATVTKITNENLTFALNFKADTVTDEQLAYYKDWYADFVLTVNKDVTFNANGGANGFLSGQYDEWSENWVSVPFEDVTLNAGESLKIMETAAEMLGQKGLKLTYNDVYSFVKDFDCGVFFEEAFLADNQDIKVTLELRMYNPENEAESYTIGETYVFTLDKVEEAQAKIGDVYYPTLVAAMNAAKNGETVTVLTDVTLTETLKVPADKAITLDLNGNTVTGTPTEAKAYAVIENKGSLTITGDGAVVCDYQLAGSTSYAVNTITNAGTLVIDGATIENKSTATNQIGYAIDNNSTTADASVTVKGGEVKASGSNYYDGIRQFCNSETNENNVTVEGGNVSSIWLQNPSDGASEKNTKDVNGSVSINGGEVGGLYLEPSTGFTASISGGHTGEVSYFQTADGRDLTGFISGGTFDEEIKPEWCAEGLEPTTNDEGKYTVKAEATTDAVVRNERTGKTYADVLAGLSEAQANDTVTLLKNAETTDVMVPADVTFDLNGYELTSAYTACYGDIVDLSDENTGLLVTAKERILIQKDNAQIPLRDGNGYRFFEVVFLTSMSEGKFVFQARVEEAAHALMRQGAEATGMTVTARVTWPDGDGEASQDFVYSDAFVNQFLDSKTATGYRKMFTLNISNPPSGLTYQALVVSETGVEIGK